MAGKVTPYTANLVTKMEPNRLMLWEKGGGTWLWLLEPIDAGHTKLITRMRGTYNWCKPTIAIDAILMEIGDPFMMRKCLLGIKRRAEMFAAERPREAIMGRPVTPTMLVSDGHGSEITPEQRCRKRIREKRRKKTFTLRNVFALVLFLLGTTFLGCLRRLKQQLGQRNTGNSVMLSVA